jgi:lambda family phage portal protein
LSTDRQADRDPYAPPPQPVPRPPRRAVLAAPRTAATAFARAAAAYSGAGTNHPGTKEWLPDTLDAAAAIRDDLERLRARSADLARNDPAAIAVIDAFRDYVIGGGLWPQSTIERALLPGLTEAQATDFQARADTLFALWAKSTAADWANRATFYDLQAVALEGILVRGDCLAILRRQAATPFPLAIELLEADRIGQPGAARWATTRAPDGSIETAGVRMDARGRIVAVHVYDEHPGATMGHARTGRWIPTTAAGEPFALLLQILRRPQQPRGIPVLSGAILPAKLRNRYTDAELMAAVANAFFTVFVRTPNGQGLEELEDPYAGTPTKDQESDYCLGSGSILSLRPGDDVAPVQTGRPNPNFAPFDAAIQRQIGQATGVPFELLAMQFNSSYSASRACLLRASKTWKRVRNHMVTQFCQPVFEAFLADMVAAGRLDAPGFLADPITRAAYSNATWHGDTFGSIDPTREADAAIARIGANLSTLAAETAELSGADWEANIRQRARERQALEAAGLPTDPPASSGAGAPPLQNAQDPATPEPPATPAE